MQTQPPEAALARALVASPRDASTLDAAAALIAAGRGEALLDALLDARRVDETLGDAAIVETMLTLEAVMPARPDVAGYLMARLYPLAGKRFLHHIADAIGLHLHASASVALADTLTRLAGEGLRPQSQRRLHAWAEAIRARAAAAR